MLEHPRALAGLSDAGAHVGTVCDASFSTFMLTHWVQGRGNGRLPLERAVEMMTSRNARYLGLADRGRIAPGLRADINLIDPSRLALPKPRLVHDLPAGGKRFLQKAEGYAPHLGRGSGRSARRRADRRAAGRLVRLGRT
jgi:N-acyl-D-aspartate/D-glutamate deacylase